LKIRHDDQGQRVLTRRSALLGGAVTLAGATLSCSLVGILSGCWRETGGIPAWQAELLGDPDEESISIGNAFLEKLPATMGELRDQLGSGADRADWATRISTDFAAGRSHYLSGWLVSSTEAQICALAVLAGAQLSSAHDVPA
jgi:hypothetical protein